MGLLRRLLLGLVLSASAYSFGDCDTQGEISLALTCLTGVTFREILPSDDPKIPAGYRRFELWIDQPVDHFNPSRGTFKQQLALLHRSSTEPLVLQTSGYQIFAVALSQLAKSFASNQIQVEHRFFNQSSPAVLDWRLMNIQQAALDFHRITLELKKIYRGRWVGTGASKGGMTSAFHRRFFPGDLDGTVSDVAPLSFAKEDSRYVKFVDEVGGDRYRDCRDNLEALQIALMRRRQEILSRITGNFVYLGGKDVAFEHAVIELPFAFWQYQNPEDAKVGCAKVPAPDAPAADLAAYLQAVNPATDYGEDKIFSFMPYYYQAATQLGGPAAALLHLSSFRHNRYSLDQYTPPRIAYSYSNAAMRDVSQWAMTRAEHIIFVYGELDPWSAGAYPKGNPARDYHWYQVPGGNHSSKIFLLPAKEKAEALSIVAGWMGKAPVIASRSGGQSLDEIELALRRSVRLP